jgi:hypothetical protein
VLAARSAPARSAGEHAHAARSLTRRRRVLAACGARRRRGGPCAARRGCAEKRHLHRGPQAFSLFSLLAADAAPLPARPAGDAGAPAGAADDGGDSDSGILEVGPVFLPLNEALSITPAAAKHLRTKELQAALHAPDDGASLDTQDLPKALLARGGKAALQYQAAAHASAIAQAVPPGCIEVAVLPADHFAAAGQPAGRSHFGCFAKSAIRRATVVGAYHGAYMLDTEADSIQKKHMQRRSGAGETRPMNYLFNLLREDEDGSSSLVVDAAPAGRRCWGGAINAAPLGADGASDAAQVNVVFVQGTRGRLCGGASAFLPGLKLPMIFIIALRDIKQGEEARAAAICCACVRV